MFSTERESMYIPKYAKHENPELIREFLESHPFATLITQNESICANHFPFLICNKSGKLRLKSHMARNNPQWNYFENDSSVLVVFQGPHAYISPSIYVNKLNVPTWNYTAVHVYGKVHAIHDSAEIEEILIDTVAKFEHLRPAPWKYDLPQSFRENLIKAIVGFSIEIERIEGKFKLSQNRAPEDYQAVVKEFSSQSDDLSIELVKYMALTST